MRGIECSQGSRLFLGVRAAEDCIAVNRYRAAGLVIFGRTHSPEFGILPTTESAIYGITRNPWALDRTAGVRLVAALQRLPVGLSRQRAEAMVVAPFVYRHRVAGCLD